MTVLHSDNENHPDAQSNCADLVFHSEADIEITRLKQIEAALQQQLRFSEALNKIAKSILEHEEANLILDDVVKIVGRELGVDHGLIYDASVEKHKVIGLSEWINLSQTLSQIHSARKWTKEQTAFLDSVSQLVRVALEKIRLMEERRQTENDMRIAATAFETQNKLAEEEIRRLAFYDPLTQLPNRRLLLDRLKQATSVGERSGKVGAILFIDLDNFKTLNDTHGHAMGDLLLQRVAQRLWACVREGDTVARIGGDEFVVMLEELSENAVEAATIAESIGMKILNALEQSHLLESTVYRSTPSIGITLFNGKDESIDELYKQADIAMYQAKKAGRNTVCFFDPEMQKTVTARVNFESEMRKAISNQDQLLLYYQAQVEFSGKITGAEALVRWDHPARGIVSPTEFIPVAEESGLILPLGHWIMTTACRQLAAWARQADTAHLTLSVNVSPKQFLLPTFADEVVTLMEFFDIDPAKLKLEITESMLLGNVHDIIIKMKFLRGKGVHFAMDDFGTGYSSLQYLKQLPIDQIKIDQSFVRDVASDDNDKAIVRTIIAMAHSLGLGVLAEGVETEEQRQFLRAEGCNSYQGYLFEKPLPISEFEESLRRQSQA